MKIILIIISLTGLSIMAEAQVAIVAGGSFDQNSEGSISWGVGEAVTQTFVAGNYVLTQGFQQGDLSVTAISEKPGLAIDIQAYPNPTRSILYLDINAQNPQDYQYLLVNQMGKVIEKQKFHKKAVQVDMHNQSAGIYLLKIRKKDEPVKVLRIVKQ